MDTQRLELTVNQFLRGPQEIVLLHRHAAGDLGRPGLLIGEQARRVIRDELRPREIKSHVTFQVGGLAVDLRCEGVYEHDANVCQPVFLSQLQAERLKPDCAPAELEALRISGWVAQHSSAEPPKALRLYYYVFGSSEPDAEICDTWYREFPLAPNGQITASIAQRTQRIALALVQPDDGLPDCDVMVRHGNVAIPDSRCRDHCPVRLHCHQMRRYYAQEMERFLAGERALASITADPETLTILEQAQDQA